MSKPLPAHTRPKMGRNDAGPRKLAVVKSKAPKNTECEASQQRSEQARKQREARKKQRLLERQRTHERVHSLVYTRHRRRLPGDNIIRAVVSNAARARRRSPYIRDFKFAVRTLGVIQKGHDSAYVLEEFLRTALEEKIEQLHETTHHRIERLKQEFVAAIGKKNVVGINRPQREFLATLIKTELRPVTRDELEQMAEAVFSDTETEILRMMTDPQRRLPDRSRQGYLIVHGRIKGKSHRPCFLLVKERKHKTPIVVGIKTAQEFRASERNRRKPREEKSPRYSNRPPAIRR